MEELLHDLRFALRGLVKKPGFSLVAILTLGLGIGAATAIFSLVETVLLKPLPYEHPDRLMLVETDLGAEGLLPTMVSGPEYLDLKAQDRLLSHVSSLLEGTFTITGEGDPWQVRALGASPSLFPLLGVEAALGRTFLPEEEGAGTKAVLLDYDFWRSRFGGDREIIERTIQVDGEAYQVVGVLPADFSLLPTDDHLPSDVDLWLAMPFDYASMNRNYRSFRVLARLQDGVSLSAAQAEMSSLAQGLEEKYPDSYRDRAWGLNLVPFQSHLVEGIKTPLLLLMTAVVGVLLIACGNVANLLLARGATRSRELALRTSLGASRTRLIRQLLTEQVVLALLGGVAGVVLAFWALKAIIALDPGRIPRLEEASLDPSVLAFAVVVSLATAVITGMVPVLRAARNAAAPTLREGGRGMMSSLSGKKVHSLLVISEVALALVVVVGTGLLLRSFQELQRVDPGFDAENVLSLRIDLPSDRYGHRADRAAFFTELLDRIERLPGVTSAGVVSHLPFTDAYWSYPVLAEGRPSRPEDEEFVDLRSASPGYFETMGARIVSGRDFQPGDDLSTPHVAILDRNLAERLFPGEDPLDKEVRVKETDLIRRVVGVVDHIHHYGLEDEPKGQLYFAYGQNPRIQTAVVVRSAVDPETLIEPVRQQIWALDKDQPAFDIATMDQRVASSLGPNRFSLVMFSLAAFIAVTLAAVGVYALLSFSVAQRHQEMGVRMALGARRVDLLRLVVLQGLRLAAFGVLVGLAATLAGVRTLDSLLYGVPAYDPVTLVAVPLALLLVVLLATLVPALRATRIDPMNALRTE
jgi:putative ABC transport system permease protein